MGHCVPVEILGPTGYFARKQDRIESIRLITDPSCEIDIASDFPVDLSAFQNLKSISWKGLRVEQDFASLGKAMQRNRDQLLELELDLFDWYTMAESLEIDEADRYDKDDTGYHNYFLHGVLGLHADDAKIMFPALQVLSLSAVSLRSAGEELARIRFQLAAITEAASLPWMGEISRLPCVLRTPDHAESSRSPVFRAC